MPVELRKNSCLAAGGLLLEVLKPEAATKLAISWDFLSFDSWKIAWEALGNGSTKRRSASTLIKDVIDYIDKAKNNFTSKDTGEKVEFVFNSSDLLKFPCGFYPNLLKTAAELTTMEATTTKMAEISKQIAENANKKPQYDKCFSRIMNL